MEMNNSTLKVISVDLDVVEKLLISVYNSLGEWLRNCEQLGKRHSADWQYDRIFHCNLAVEKALFEILPSVCSGICRFDEKLKNFDPHADFKKLLHFPEGADDNDPGRDPAAGSVADNLVQFVPDEHEGEVSDDGNEER